MAIGNPIRADGHFAFLSDQGDQNALEHRNPGRKPPEKCDKASAFLTEKLTRRDCKACDLIHEWVSSSGDTILIFSEIGGVLASGKLWKGGRDSNSETFR